MRRLLIVNSGGMEDGCFYCDALTNNPHDWAHLLPHTTKRIEGEGGLESLPPRRARLFFETPATMQSQLQGHVATRALTCLMLEFEGGSSCGGGGEKKERRG